MKFETFEAIEASVKHARKKHPVFPSTHSDALSILGEEYGEACEANNEKDYPHCHHEILDIIAVGVRMLEELPHD